MDTISFSSYIEAKRSQFFAQRSQFTIFQKLGFALVFACLTGLAAQLRLPLPWTPVPITGQTCAVLISGALLGAFWGGISQLIYVMLGVAGVPWFSHGGSGLSWLIGPTGGYLIGFILNTFFIGYVVDSYPKVKSFCALVAIMFFGNFFFVHLLGVFQLHLWLSFIQHTPKTIWQLLLAGWFPFIIGDVIKTVIAATITSRILLKK